jgi:S-formylglutathione hydrolase FrmB
VITRRQLLHSAALLAGAGLGEATVAGCSGAPAVLSGPVAGAGGVTGTAGGDGAPTEATVSAETGQLRSAALGRSTSWLLLRPDVAPPPLGLRLVVALPGRGGDETMMVGLLVAQSIAAAARAGTPVAVVSVGGGDSYWHPRRDGTDAGAMVTAELVPMLAEHGVAATAAIALLGWSMGGYGVLRLAQQLGSARVAAVAAVSPALWLHPGDSAPGAFDDAEDFRRNDVFAARDRLRGIPLRIDCGLSDPFLRATRSFVSGCHPAPEGGFTPGGHDGDYWRGRLPAELTFLARRLHAAR